MYKISSKILVPIAVLIFSSCTKMKDTGILNTDNFSDNAAALKDAADIPMGVAIDFPAMVSNSAYSGVVKRDFDRVTFGNLMKHSSIVKTDLGIMDFTNTDALVASVGSMDIFGHTLGWHSQQNANYLKLYSGLFVPAAVELTSNSGFESGMTGWSIFNTNGATIAASSAAGEARTGTTCMKVINPTAQTGNQWKVQVSSSNLATTPGKQYVISYWVKALTPGGSIRLSTGPTAAQYQGDQTIGTTYQNVIWTITATINPTTFLFDMGQNANTYFIDDVSVKEVVSVPTGAAITAKLDTALGNYITPMVNRYKSKVKAWDVINELIDDNGNLRNNANTPPPSATATDWFVWSNYLGRDYAFKAFKYAEAADPTAILFINDYNLESKPIKLDSLIKMVAELKGRGAKVDGIGTQMHITRTTSYDGIDKMFQKLAATGLKIHISELDVRINPANVPGYILTDLEQNYQAQMYNYVVKSYLKYIPKAQQYGITVWGVSDDTSWLYNGGKDFPLMYNADFSKKQAYTGVLNALKGK